MMVHVSTIMVVLSHFLGIHLHLLWLGDLRRVLVGRIGCAEHA